MRSFHGSVVCGVALLGPALFVAGCDSGTSGPSTNSGGGSGGAPELDAGAQEQIHSDAGAAADPGDRRDAGATDAGNQLHHDAGGVDDADAGAVEPSCETVQTECSGLCVDTANDPENCGVCGRLCSNDHGTTSCVASACVPLCSVGFDNCDGSVVNGCETNTQGDPLNCGGCGIECQDVANADATCDAGTCGAFVCRTGFADCNFDPSDGCEVNVLSDGAHCGSCGIDCAGGGCNVGGCGAPPSTLASGLSGPQGIAVHGAKVYWATQDEISTVSVDGGVPSSVTTTDGGGNYLVVDDNNVYWTERDALMKAPAAGGSPTTLAAVPDWSPYGLALDASNVYWTDYRGHSVMKVATAGGTPTTLATLGTNPVGLAVDATRVYWLDGHLKSVPIAAGAITVHADVGGIAMALDGTHAYWVDVSGGDVMTCALAACVPTALAVDQDGPHAIAVDGANVYWLNRGTFFNDREDGSVMKVPKAGGAIVQLASWQSLPVRIAVDAENVYWTNLGGGEVMKIAK